MPRTARRSLFTPAACFHILNRGHARETIFHDDEDRAEFLIRLDRYRQRFDFRLYHYCLLPNHWHMVVWPQGDDDLSEYFRWVTVTHTQRWHAHHHTAGTGPVYQGRFKSFPVECDEHLLTVCRYVERNALRAKLMAKAEQWRWGSLWHRVHLSAGNLLQDGPVPLPANWVRYVNEPQTAAELAVLRRSVVRGTPFGDSAWQVATARRLGLESTLRPRGRPDKKRAAAS
jgi:putative transposase